jgi:hypothetical protein
MRSAAARVRKIMFEKAANHCRAKRVVREPGSASRRCPVAAPENIRAVAPQPDTVKHRFACNLPATVASLRCVFILMGVRSIGAHD